MKKILNFIENNEIFNEITKKKKKKMCINVYKYISFHKTIQNE